MSTENDCGEEKEKKNINLGRKSTKIKLFAADTDNGPGNSF